MAGQGSKTDRGGASKFDWTQAAGLLVLLVILGYFWNTWAVYPLKILVVFFHEISHGIAAVATGGRVEEIELVAAQGGLCVTAGGNRFITLSAGYLGSLAWGGVILWLASRTRLDKAVTAMLGLLLLTVTVALVRPVVHFGFAFGILAGAALLAMGGLLPQGVNAFALRLIGLTSCVYAILDIKSDVLDRPHMRSDATMLADATGLPALFWGLIWMGAAILAAWYFLMLSCRKRESAQVHRAHADE